MSGESVGSEQLQSRACSAVLHAPGLAEVDDRKYLLQWTSVPAPAESLTPAGRTAALPVQQQARINLGINYHCEFGQQVCDGVLRHSSSPLSAPAKRIILHFQSV